MTVERYIDVSELSSSADNSQPSATDKDATSSGHSSEQQQQQQEQQQTSGAGTTR